MANTARGKVKSTLGEVTAIKARMLAAGEIELAEDSGRDVVENALLLECEGSDWRVRGGRYFVIHEDDYLVPELVAALDRIMDYAHTGAAVRDVLTSEQPEFIAARKVLAKARGETP